jgi:hypothetical protein
MAAPKLPAPPVPAIAPDLAAHGTVRSGRRRIWPFWCCPLWPPPSTFLVVPCFDLWNNLWRPSLAPPELACTSRRRARPPCPEQACAAPRSCTPAPPGGWLRRPELAPDPAEPSLRSPCAYSARRSATLAGARRARDSRVVGQRQRKRRNLTSGSLLKFTKTPLIVRSV